MTMYTSKPSSSQTDLNSLDHKLLQNFQKEFPLSARPFLDIAQQLNVEESTVIERYQQLSEQGIISRIGPVFNPHKVGASTLAAMAIDEKKLEQTANFISKLNEVNHNYQREHEYNLWFVVTAETEEKLQQVFIEIESFTGLQVMQLPMIKSFHIDLGFAL